MVEGLPWDVVLFDLDGTIVDPFDGIADGVRKAFAEVGEPAPADESIRSWIGPPIGETLAAELGHLGPDAVATALATFRQSYDNGGAQSATLHSGMRDLIIGLQGAGTYVAVVTMKPRHVTDQVLEQHDLRRALDGVFAPLADQRAPSKAKLVGDSLVEASQTRGSLLNGVVIGDRAEDITAAHEHMLQGIGVLWGYGSEDELAAAGANHIFVDSAELTRFITQR
jgi:phosphoglycolate phosphatase